MAFIKFESVTELVSGPKIMFELPVHIGGKPIQIPETVTTTWVIMALFLVFFIFATKKLAKYPSTIQSILEIIYSFYDWLVESVMGKNKNVFLVYISTLMSFILASNLVGLFPIPSVGLKDGIWAIGYAFKAPTSDLNTTFGLAMLTAILFTYFGIKANGITGHIKSFMAPTPIMLPLNLISEAAKPVSISMRLFGNAMAGGVIMGIVYMFASKVPLLPMVVAPLHLYFDLFASLVQSFIFTMLTMIFITQAIGDGEIS
jgi:F-type H+-transporting ATPase subunit a